MRYIIQLIIMLLLINIVFGQYKSHSERQRRPYVVPNQRSTDGKFKYAWFTRDIHDDEDNRQEHYRMKLLKDIFNET